MGFVEAKGPVAPLGSRYLRLPLLWSGIMACARVKVGRSIEVATSALRNPAQDAGRQSGAIDNAALSKGTRR